MTQAIKTASREKKLELSEEELSSVSGGDHKASPVLRKACATGTHMREATIVV